MGTSEFKKKKIKKFEIKHRRIECQKHDRSASSSRCTDKNKRNQICATVRNTLKNIQIRERDLVVASGTVHFNCFVVSRVTTYAVTGNSILN